MIVEERQYLIRPKHKSAFWGNYKERGLPIQIRFLSKPIGFFFVDIGDTSTFVHMWAFSDYDQRQMQRHLLHECQEWNDYVRSSHKYIKQINTRILRPLANEHSLLPGVSATLGYSTPSIDT